MEALNQLAVDMNLRGSVMVQYVNPQAPKSQTRRFLPRQDAVELACLLPTFGAEPSPQIIPPHITRTGLSISSSFLPLSAISSQLFEIPTLPQASQSTYLLLPSVRSLPRRWHREPSFRGLSLRHAHAEHLLLSPPDRFRQVGRGYKKLL